MKSRPSPRRKPPSRDLVPPEVPEVASVASPATKEDADLLPEHIRRMLEAAYT